MSDKISSVDTTTQVPAAHVVSYVHGAYMVPMKGMIVKTSKGSFDCKLKILVHFLRVKKDPRATSPSNKPKAKKN